jgi:PAS domain S-box-containing protein
MKKTKILIVEDEFIVANNIETRLLDLGYAVSGKADTGATAIELAETQSPDLVLMDIRLKGPIDGITAAAEIRRRFKLPVVFLAAYVDDRILDQAKSAEPAGYILKPFDDRELRTNIEIAVYKHKAELEIRRLTRLYAILGQVNGAILRVRSRQELFQNICQIAVGVGQFKTAWIGWLDADTGALKVSAKAGEGVGILAECEVCNCTCSLEAIKSGKPVIINELQPDTDSAPCPVNAQSSGVRGCGAYPIRLDEEVCGVFVVGTDEADFFSYQKSSLVEEVAHNISFAIDKFETERRREKVEKATKEHEQQLETILKTTLDGFAIVDIHGNFREVNDAYCAMSGYSRDELLKINISDVEFNESKVDTTDHIQQIKRQRGDRFESRHRRKDGKVIDVAVSVTFQDREGGQIVSFFRDITEHKRIETDLRFKNTLLTTQQEASIYGILVVDNKGGILSHNRRFTEIWGISSKLIEDKIDAPVLRFVAEQVADTQGFLRKVEYIDEHRQEKSRDEVVLTDGRFLDRYSAPMLEPDGRYIGRVFFFHDITDLKRTEIKLRESQQRLQAAMLAARLGVWSRDLITGEISMDSRARAIWGVAADVVITYEGLLNLIVAEDRKSFELMDPKQHPDDGEAFRFECRVVMLDGSIHWIQGRGSSVQGDSGSQAHLTGVVMDVTDTKLAEQELTALEEQFRQAQKLEAVGRLAGGIAHDFNNLLMVIMAQTEILAMRLDGSQSHRAEAILKSTRRAAELTGQLLAFSRKQTIQPTVTSMNRLVTGVSDMLERLMGEDIELKIVLHDDPWSVKTDRSQFEQVIMNLVVNARDAMPDGGRLTLETANCEIGNEYTATHPLVPAGKYAMLAVSDTGHGMSQEVRTRLFEPFFTTKPEGKGTGLGLSMVYGIVKKSEGFVWVYSELGQGSCFKIYLPNAEPSEAEEPEGGTSPTPPMIRKKATVLLVEDEENLREVVAEFLRSGGHEVIVAGSLDEACFAAVERRIDIGLLLTDVILKGGNAKQLVHRLEKQGCWFRVVYMSGYTPSAIVHHGVMEPETLFLQKPFSRSALLDMVEVALSPEQ